MIRVAWEKRSHYNLGRPPALSAFRTRHQIFQASQIRVSAESIPPLPGDQIDGVPSRNSTLQFGRGCVLDFLGVSPRDNSCGNFPDLVTLSERDKT